MNIFNFFLIVHSISCFVIVPINGFHKGKYHEPIYVKPNIDRDGEAEIFVGDRHEELATSLPRSAKLASEDAVDKPGETSTNPPSSTSASANKKESLKVTSSSEAIKETPNTTLAPKPNNGASTTSKTPTTSLPSTTTTSTPLTAVYCLCDIHRSVCDMNCCCDIDCTDDDRHFFSHCDDQPIQTGQVSVLKQRSCYKSFVTFRYHNIDERVEKDNGMLCILRDNSKTETLLPVSKLTEITKRIIEGDIDIRPKFFLDSTRTMQYKLEPYKYGSPIVGIMNSDLSQKTVEELVAYGLPAIYQEGSCKEIREPVKFLENFYSRCEIRTKNLTRDCQVLDLFNASSFVNQLQILKSPGTQDSELIPITWQKICNNKICVLDTDDIDFSTFERPLLNKGKKLCQNILTGFNLTFNFDLDGISEILATAQLIDLPTSTTTQVIQEYRANFVWISENHTSTLSKELPRSGNPGYIVGKPVIWGQKISVPLEVNESVTESSDQESDETKDVVAVSTNPLKQWVTVQGPGKCSDKPEEIPKRRPIQFDYSHISLCSMNLTQFKYCEDLQLQIAKILLGVDDPLNFEKTKWHVAAFGNSNPTVPSEWVPVTFKSFSIPSSSQGNSKNLVSRGCGSLIASLDISIAYAFVGPVEFPQAKITGVLFELGEPVSVRIQEVSKSFSIASTVTFKDVTAPPITRVAKWPVLSIKLPSDFFYPFKR